MKILLELDNFDRDEVIEKVVEKVYEQVIDEDIADKAAQYLCGGDAIDACADQVTQHAAFVTEVAKKIIELQKDDWR